MSQKSVEELNALLENANADIGQLRDQLKSARNENESLKQQFAALGAEALPAELLALVREKERSGMTRNDAVEVARRQLAHDATNPHDKAPVAINLPTSGANASANGDKTPKAKK